MADDIPTTADVPQPTPRRWRRFVVRGVVVAFVFLLGWRFLLLVQEAREAARKTVCLCTFCGVTLAFHNHHDQHGELPRPWSSDDEGRPLLSWRLTILNFLDGNDLLADAKPTAPWDDPANTPLLARRPQVWGCPSHPDYESQYAHKAAVTGRDTAFPGDRPVRFDDVTDGLAYTLCVAEIKHRVPWTKPEDVDGPSHTAIGMPGGFDSHHPSGINVGLLDGGHRTLSRNIDPEVMRLLVLRNDGQTERARQALGWGR